MKPSACPARRPLRASVLAIALAVLAGCSSGGDHSAASSPSTDRSATAGAPTAVPPSVPQSASESSTPAGGASSGSSGGGGSGPDRCHTGDLTATLTAGDAGAGQRSAVLTLEDTGSRTCRVEGYGGIGLVGADGRALPTEQQRVDPAPTLVTLAPGVSARSRLQWTVVPGSEDPAAGCPVPASLAVIPPDETDPVSVGWSLGPVCGGGRVQQQAYTG